MSIAHLSTASILVLALVLHTLIGLTGTLIAYSKGRSLSLWLFIGLLAGTAAFIVALLLHTQADSATSRSTLKIARATSFLRKEKD